MSTGTLVKIILGVLIVLGVATYVLWSVLPLEKWLLAFTNETVLLYNARVVLVNASYFGLMYLGCTLAMLIPLYMVILIERIVRKRPKKKKVS